MTNEKVNEEKSFEKKEKKHEKVKASKRPERKTFVRILGETDRPFLIIICTILCFGLVMVFTSSYAFAKNRFNDSYYFAFNQLKWVIVGLIIMGVVAMFADYRFVEKFTPLFYLCSLVLNALVIFIGDSSHGARRWLTLGPIQFQPSEIMKLATVLMCARIISKNRDKMKTLRYGVLPFVAILAPEVLILIGQKHMSATIIVCAIVFFMMLIGGTRITWLLGFLGIIGGTVCAVLYIEPIRNLPFLADKLDHVFARLEVWKDPVALLKDPATKDMAYQPAQSLFAISAGGFWGLGIGQSNQKHGFLPEPQNDYIFSIWCEETGFFGAVVLIILFAAFTYRGFKIANNSPNKFCAMVIMGSTLKVALQTFLNIGVVTGLLPATGIMLPFCSYGGTALLMLMAEMGMVLSFSKYSYVQRD